MKSYSSRVQYSRCSHFGDVVIESQYLNVDNIAAEIISVGRHRPPFQRGNWIGKSK